MKRYVKTEEIINTEPTTTHINVVVNIGFDGDTDTTIAAATYKDVNVPDGSVISGEPESEYTKEEIERYHNFIDSIVELAERFYKMEVYYKNESDYYSDYLGMLAKSKDGLVIVDFDFTLRIATHPAHRTDRSEKEKKKQEQQLSDRLGGLETKPMRDQILVNGEKFESYIFAFEKIDNIISQAHEVMVRNEKYRKKIQ